MTRRDYWITDPVLSALLRYRASVIGGSWRSRGLPIATFSDQMHPSPASKKRGRQHVTTRLMLSASAAGAVWISASSAQAQLCPVINSTVVRSGNGQCTIANSTLIGSDFTFPYPFPTVAASDGAQITTNTNNVTIAPQNGGTIGCWRKPQARSPSDPDQPSEAISPPPLWRKRAARSFPAWIGHQSLTGQRSLGPKRHGGQHLRNRPHRKYEWRGK